jgi:hypothetical protein
MTLAIFVSAFQSGPAGIALAEMAYESIDLDVRNVVNGISRALGPLARAEALTRSGDRNANLSIGEDLGAAVIVFRKVKTTPGMTVAKYLSQAQLFERELTDFQETILKDIDSRSRSAKRIGTVIRNYAQAVIDSPPPGQIALIPVDGLTKESLWAAAVKKADSELTAAAVAAFRNVLDYYETGCRSPQCSPYPTQQVEACVAALEASGEAVNPWAICQLEAGCGVHGPLEVFSTPVDGRGATFVTEDFGDVSDRFSSNPREGSRTAWEQALNEVLAGRL